MPPRPAACEAVRHLLQQFLVFTAYDGEALLGLGLLVHLGDPGFKPTLERIDAEPAILGRIGVDPLRGVTMGFAEGGPDLLGLPAKLSHKPAGLPLSLPPNIPIDPKAPTAGGDDAEGFCVIATAYELTGVGKHRALFEAEGVDVAEMTGLYLCLRKPRSARPCWTGHIAVGVAASQALGNIVDAFDMFLAWRIWDHGNGLWRLAFQVRAELADQYVAKQLVSVSVTVVFSGTASQGGFPPASRARRSYPSRQSSRPCPRRPAIG